MCAYVHVFMALKYSSVAVLLDSWMLFAWHPTVCINSSSFCGDCHGS
jgi:hypothetical protein